MYDDNNRTAEDGEVNSSLKYDRSGKVAVILVPQPSDDPNDPLVISALSTILPSTVSVNEY